MSLFRKPKKNIRRRNVDSDDEEKTEFEPELMDVDELKSKLKVPDGQTKAATLLSFADDEEDNGEVFQVRKSSYSKKLERKLDRQRRRRREKMEDGMFVDRKNLELEPESRRLGDIVKNEDEARDNDDEEEEEMVKEVQLEMEEEQQKKQAVILNGRAALMAGKDDPSSSEEDEGSARYKFSQTNRAEIMIESGTIPDAATIHAARKRRQRARQLNHDFIPVATTTTTTKPKPLAKGTSRLIREDEEDGSDEERINMGTGVEANDLNARRQQYLEDIDDMADPETEILQPTWPIADPASELLPLPPPPPPLSVTNSKELAPPEMLTSRLRERLASLKDVHQSHCRDVVRVATELAEHTGEVHRLEAEAPDLAAKFRFYQDMRGYVTDLVECLDEKVPGLLKLEEAALKLWADRTMNFSSRRRLDIRDQSDEISIAARNTTVPMWSKDEEEARARRAAEREGRRSRRRRARELRSLSVAHVDGMSSDDEETELESANFQNKLDELIRLGAGLLEDVEDDFGSVDGIGRRLERWREFDITAYQEAYASLCLPKMLGPIIRIHLLTWNPLQPDAMELDCTSWWHRLALYGLTKGETLESLGRDPDLLLIPIIVEKAILPKVADLVVSAWDPLSSSQTLRLVSFLKKYVIDGPGVSAASPQVIRLLDAVATRMRQAVDNDVFIPLQLIGGEVKGSSTPFFQRQFASAVKLLRNILSMQGLASQVQIYEIALDALLNRYLLAALRICSPADAVSKANIIMSTFPRGWFQGDAKIPKLVLMCRQLKHLSSQIDPSERDNFELINNLLRTIQSACPAVS